MNEYLESMKGLIKVGVDVNRGRPKDSVTSMTIANAKGHLAE